MAIGLMLSTTSGTFDPADLTLAGWWRASYSASPWVGTASAGASSGRNLTEGVNPPATGAALNALVPADFDGSNDRLTSAVAMSSFVSSSAGSFICLFNSDTAPADAGAAANFSNPGLIQESTGRLSLSFCSAGVRFGSYSGASDNSLAVACGTGGWHVATARWDATTLRLSVDFGAFSSLAHTVALAAGTTVVGSNWNSTVPFNGRIAELMTMQTSISDADLARVRTYINSRYGLSL